MPDARETPLPHPGKYIAHQVDKSASAVLNITVFLTTKI